MDDVDVVGTGAAAGERFAGALLQSCGGARLSGEAVASQVAVQLAAK